MVFETRRVSVNVMLFSLSELLESSSKTAEYCPLCREGGSHLPVLSADCGAGVGRVTESLLLHLFHVVDLLEPSKHLLATAEEKCSGSGLATEIPAGHGLGQSFCMGLQAWQPSQQRCASPTYSARSPLSVSPLACGASSAFGHQV